MNNIISYLLVALLCSFPFTAEGSELTNAVQTKYAAIHSVQGQFIQVLTHKESGSVETREGTFVFAKPDLLRWETITPNPELLITTNDAVWNYLQDEEVAYKYPAQLVHESKTVLRFMAGQVNLTEEFYIEPQDDSGTAKKLALFAKEPTPQMTEAVVWIDPKTFTIRRAKIVDFYGNTNDVRFVNIVFDDAVKKESFMFTPPEGVDIEDRTEGMSGADLQ